jgi:hypothetical protein
VKKKIGKKIAKISKFNHVSIIFFATLFSLLGRGCAECQRDEKMQNNPEMFIFKKGNRPVQVIFEELNGKENIFIIPNFRGSPYLFWSVINTQNC